MPAWLANPHEAEIITVTYESLQQKPVEQLQLICEFAGLERPRSVLESVVRSCSFAEMSFREQTYGWHDANWPRDKNFARRGIVGSFQDEMPTPVLEAFLGCSTATLRRLGYI